MYKRVNLVLALFVAAAASGCQLGGDYGTAEQAILDGENAFNDFQSTCVMKVDRPPDEDGNMQDPIFCTCTLVSDRIVLTAARCVDDNVEAETLEDIDLRFGTGFEQAAGNSYAIEEVELHRYFDPEQEDSNAIALLRLASSPGVTPVTLNETPLTDEDMGTDLTLVGFGEKMEGQNDEGPRRKTTVPIRTVGAAFVFAGTEEATTCDGDSGGPGFVDLGDGRVQATVTLFHPPDTCSRNVQRARVDVHLEDFIHPYIDRFNGPCQLDGTCVESGCRSPDPDCDPCLWDEECVEDCPTRDVDCPLGSFVGEACEKSGDCEEGGRCVAALDDEEFTYCTRPCEPGSEGECPMDMTCEDLGDGAGECIYETPSPGSQGYPCGANLDCRSGICEDAICVDECQDQSDCEEPYSCGPSKVADGATVCLGDPLSGGGGFGFCAAGGDAGKEWPALVAGALLALALLGRRRRRRA